METPRLQLRKFVDSDLESILEVIGDPEVMKFSVTGPESREGAEKFLASNYRRYERDGCGQWAVLIKETGECIGECGISVQYIGGVKEYEISYRVLRSLWGKGLGSEAAIACRNYGFDKLSLKRLISIVEQENAASIRVAQKMGMKLEKRSTFFDIPVEIYVCEKS